jgi:hypothetical protein
LTGSRHDRELDNETRASAIVPVLDPGPSAVEPGVFGHEGEPQADTPSGAAGVLAPVEPLEYPLNVFGWNAGAPVLHDDPGPLGIGFDADTIDATGVDTSVAHEVHDDLLEAALVGADDHIGGRRGNFHRDVAVGHGFHGVEDELTEVDLLGGGVDDSGVEPAYRNRLGKAIPQRVIDRPPSAELRPDQKDSDSLPPYEVLDPILEAFIEEDLSVDEIEARGFDRTTVGRVLDLVKRNEYKRRQAPPGVRVSRRAFGRDWRYPITNGYRR